MVSEVLANIHAAFQAARATSAGCGLHPHHRIADPEFFYAGSESDNIARRFVSERAELELGVAAPVGLEIGATGEGSANAHHRFAGGRLRRWQLGPGERLWRFP